MMRDQYDYDDFYFNDEGPASAVDGAQVEARNEVEKIFLQNKERVFFSRQIEVRLEDKYFHWITNRAIREMIGEKVIVGEKRRLKTGGEIHLIWNRNYRYYRREASKVINLVEEYADPNIAGAIGLNGETMVLEGFARHEFVMKGRNTKKYKDNEWNLTDHNLDFIFEKDGLLYGIEVKNTLGYMDYKELEIKIKMCKELGLKPVFVARMMPKTWIKEIIDEGGFCLILKYQLYPWTHKELAKKIAKELNLPVDAPRIIEDGTMARFIRWHKKRM
jgi:hypothetical protein